MHLALSESSGDKNWAVRILSKMGIFPGEMDSSCFSSHMLNKRPSRNYLMPLFFFCLFVFNIFVICIGGFPVLKWPQVQRWSCLSRVCKCKKAGKCPHEWEIESYISFPQACMLLAGNSVLMNQQNILSKLSLSRNKQRIRLRSWWKFCGQRLART